MKYDNAQSGNYPQEKGWLETIEFLPQFNIFFSQSFLASISSFIDPGKEDTWLHKLMRMPRVACHPLRHLLVLAFLGETVSSMIAELGEIHSDKQSLNYETDIKSKFVSDKPRIRVTKQRVNWETRDAEIAEKIYLVADEIRGNYPQLMRVTRTEIGRRLRIQPLLIRAINKLPKTQETITKVVETIEQFQIRRIKQAVDIVSQKNVTVHSWEVKRVAGIKKKFEERYEQVIALEIKLLCSDSI